ncbi:polyprotein [Clonorchis sinensis]|uniref:Polyprotein n=1 Tax=Clonorchis sinensis TaxID=79923 RepID=H2KVA6_CLOSI|nr:polyprotein [Clonorchis sinensis]
MPSHCNRRLITYLEQKPQGSSYSFRFYGHIWMLSIIGYQHSDWVILTALLCARGTWLLKLMNWEVFRPPTTDFSELLLALNDDIRNKVIRGRVFNTSITKTIQRCGCPEFPAAFSGNTQTVLREANSSPLRHSPLGLMLWILRRQCFRWLRLLCNVLCMPSYQLLRRVLVSTPKLEWQTPGGRQTLIWKKGMKDLTRSLDAIGAVRYPGCGPSDPSPETLNDMTPLASFYIQTV